MASHVAANGESRPSRPVRDPGDAWVEGARGERFWGRFGAAGLLAYDSAQGVLLQHRAQWSHYGGTWGIPGGALQQGEAPIVAALREAHEEAAVPAKSIRLRGTRVIDRDVWSYTTLVSEVIAPFEPQVGDAESVELAWVPIAKVTQLPLHPAFGQAWPALAQLLRTPPTTVVVDAANVVGSVPNGWWRDRHGANESLIAQLAHVAANGLPAPYLGLDATTWYVSIDVIVEGAARNARAPLAHAHGDQHTPATGTGITVVGATGSGDDAVVEQARARLTAGGRVLVVTGDRELRTRVAALGADNRSASWLLEIIGD